MPGPHVLTPPPNHATSVRHYCPLCAATRRNGVHEFVLGPKLSIGDLGLPQILSETDFYVVDLEKVNRQNR